MKGVARAVMLVGLMCASAGSFAETLYVGPNLKYKTIQAAINAATTNDTIEVAANTYIENITLRAGITLTLVGTETARTFLKALDNSKPIISASGITNNRISRFTFIDSTTGIQLNTASTVTIAANVFNLGTEGTAVKVLDAADKSTITNNTFYKNKSAISSAATGTKINNNIFASNTTAIADAHADTVIATNHFFNNNTNGSTGTDSVTDAASDPSFVDPDPAVRDFHATKSVLKERGAYSGDHADSKLFPVRGVNMVVSEKESPLFSVTVSWSANKSYLVEAYAVQFELTGSTQKVVNFGSPPDSRTSPHNVGNVLSVTLTGSALSDADVVAVPELISIEPQSQALKLTWTPVTNATGYEVHYGVGSANEVPKNVGNVTSYTLTGLQNNLEYSVSIVAVRQPVLRVAIAAQRSTSVTDNTNDYSVSGVAATLGEPKTSGRSEIRTAFPEEVVPYPALPNEGCFIATAAYGSDSAAQVKTLRDFRDYYLLTNKPGRAFVAWYYANSPQAAQYLNQHPALKPVVRGLLLPFVLITSGLNDSMLGMQVALIAWALGMLGLGFYWRRRHTSWA